MSFGLFKPASVESGCVVHESTSKGVDALPAEPDDDMGWKVARGSTCAERRLGAETCNGTSLSCSEGGRDMGPKILSLVVGTRNKGNPGSGTEHEERGIQGMERSGKIAEFRYVEKYVLSDLLTSLSWAISTSASGNPTFLLLRPGWSTSVEDVTKPLLSSRLKWVVVGVSPSESSLKWLLVLNSGCEFSSCGVVVPNGDARRLDWNVLWKLALQVYAN